MPQKPYFNKAFLGEPHVDCTKKKTHRFILWLKNQPALCRPHLIRVFSSSLNQFCSGFFDRFLADAFDLNPLFFHP